ncbi:hypothetical protein PF008_g20561 [Phytophthora fragariae]|uniref:Secreted protein n=1 Tax=Phytophthora fragariae TaxID=53985 RepID=A0A6G0QZD9_9STRA|nr:hypothetical protein PF008_g20561 [Phytophthora fragariae]
MSLRPLTPVWDMITSFPIVTALTVDCCRCCTLWTVPRSSSTQRTGLQVSDIPSAWNRPHYYNNGFVS